MLIDNAVISGSLIVSGTLVDFTQVDVISGSIFSGSFVGDGSQLVGVTGAGFPYAGTAVISGSLIVSGSNTDTIDFTNMQSVSGSIFSGSFVGDGSSLTGVTSYTDTDTLDYINSVGVISGSNQLAGTTITGDLTLTGILTAQELHAEFISSSIIYSSGSNKFGDLVTDRHQFTGSIDISGSIQGMISSSAQIASQISGAFDLSGDNTFGSSLTNLHQFTGSLAVSSSNNSYFLGGNVGIGTTSPSGKLSLGYTGDLGGAYKTWSTVEQGSFEMTYIESNSNNYARTLDIASIGEQDGSFGGGEIRFITNPNTSYTGSSRMIITSTGNVGIGTETPSYKLDVVGDATISGTLTANIITGSLIQLSTGSLAVSASTDSYFIGGGNVGIGTASPVVDLHIKNTSGISTFVVGNDPAQTTNNERAFKIQAHTNGNVYFDSKVHTGGAMYFRYGEGGQLGANSTWMTMDGGNVGIGTTSPDSRLHVKGEGGVNLNGMTLEHGTEGSKWGLVIGGSSNSFPGGFTIADEGTAKLTINSSGSVGIGTTSPQNKLDVEGGAVIGATYSGTNTAPTNGLLVEGNVGIGATSPHASASLDVTSTTKGFLPPRMTSTQRNAISSPPAGLIIYNTTTSLLNYVSGSVWMQVSGSVAP